MFTYLTLHHGDGNGDAEPIAFVNDAEVLMEVLRTLSENENKVQYLQSDFDVDWLELDVSSNRNQRPYYTVDRSFCPHRTYGTSSRRGGHDE